MPTRPCPFFLLDLLPPTACHATSYRPCRVRHGRICGRRVEDSLIRGATSYRVSHSVVGIQHEASRAVLSIAGTLVSLQDRELIEDVNDSVAWAREQAAELRGSFASPLLVAPEVEVEEAGVELGAKESPALGVVAEGRAVIAQVLGERLQVPGGVGEFQHPGRIQSARVSPATTGRGGRRPGAGGREAALR
jgi:hypothetical protein